MSSGGSIGELFCDVCGSHITLCECSEKGKRVINKEAIQRLHSSFTKLRSADGSDEEHSSSEEDISDKETEVAPVSSKKNSASDIAQPRSRRKVIALLHEENERLHRRVGQLEQDMWQLKSSVRGDGEEKANLQKQLKQKSEVVARHFEEVARKDSKRSLFGPSAKDINSKMQEALEEALSENVEVRALNEKCDLEVSQLKKIFEQEVSTVQALEVTLMTKENEIHQQSQKVESLNAQLEEKNRALLILTQQLEQAGKQPRGAENISVQKESVTDSVLQGENERLIERLAHLQERMWGLESAKKTYEEEILRLNNDLTIKSNIILAHFSDAAKKHSTKFGAGLFGPSAAEVNTQLQAALEASLNDNMKLQGQLQQQKSALDHAMGVIGEAEAQGYIVVDSDKEDDKFE